MHSIIVFLALAATAFSAPTTAPTGSDGNCQSLGPNGALIDSGFVYYLCKDGKLYPQGCVTRDQKRVELGQTTDYRQSRLSCEMGGKQLPSLVVKACVQQGKEQAIGSTFTDGKVAYKCETGTDEAKLTVVGCANEGKPVQFDEKVTKTDAVYICDKASNTLKKSGCVRDGKQFNIGDSFEVANTWYNCTRAGPKASGCISGGKRLNDGDRFFENDVIFECFIENDKVDLRVAGCVQHDGASTVERRLNCFWVEGPEPLQYEWTCRHTAGANTAEKVQIRCNYKVSKGVYSIEPGCFRVIDKAAFGCVKTGTGLNLQSFQGDDAAKAAASAGLSAC